MSGSPEFVELSGRRSPEKTSFSQTCSLLSQYLKEKCSFGDLSLGIRRANNVDENKNGSLEIMHQEVMTMDLFPMIDKPGHVSNRNLGVPRDGSMDLFRQQADLTHVASEEDVQKSPDTGVVKGATTEAKTAQMTIFYSGQVIVFDDFPADKAKEIMNLASNGISQGKPAFPSVSSKVPPVFTSNLVKPPTESSSSIQPSSSAIPNFSNSLFPERITPPRQAIATDLPIARRASLHRFLEKRKDRLTAKSPYHTSRANTSKPADSKPWLGLAA